MGLTKLFVDAACSGLWSQLQKNNHRRVCGVRRLYRSTALDLLVPTILWSGMLAATAKASAAAEGGECCEAAAIFKRVNGGVSRRGEAVDGVD